MRIALTGGAGYLGSALLDLLAEEGHHVRALVHRTPVRALPGVESFRGNLDDPPSLMEFVTGADAVIHVGGVVAARHREDFHRVNAEGTRHLAEACATAAVPRFLLISSLAAREPQLSPYAGSKRAGEAALTGTPGLGWDILRPPAIYGGDDRQLRHLLMPLKYRLALLPSGPEARASVIHVEDAATAILAWLESNAATRRVYEIDDGEESGHRWKDMLSVAARLLGVTPLYLTPPSFLLDLIARIGEGAAGLSGRAPFLTRGKLAEMAHPDWVADSRPFRDAFRWQPRWTFEAGMADTVERYRARGWL